MLQVKITKEEVLKLSYKEYGITSEKCKITKEWKTVYFCSNLVFIKNFSREKEFISI